MHPAPAHDLMVNHEPFEDIVDGDDFCFADELDEDYSMQPQSDEEALFDTMIEKLEDVMMEQGFSEKIEAFCRENCQVFEDSEENKLEYTDLFMKYMSLIELYIENRLKQEIPHFDMNAFCHLLAERADDIPLDLDTLGGFGDFEAFKAMMIGYKLGDQEQMGGLSISGEMLAIHADEMEDGVAMPDLMLTITPASPARK